MKIFGAGSLEDIKKCTELGVAGILTNPQGFDVYYKGEMTLEEITKAILDVSDTPVFYTGARPKCGNDCAEGQSAAWPFITR